MKKIFIIFTCLSMLILGGCSSMGSCMKAIEGKDGVFAIMDTSKGCIALELYILIIIFLFVCMSST